MEKFKNQLLAINNGEYTDSELLDLFQVIAEKLNIGSVKDIANDNGKSQQGVRDSNRFRKIRLRSVLCVTDKLRETKFPF